MAREINVVLILGLGKVGHLVGELLRETGFEVIGADVQFDVEHDFETHRLDMADPTNLDSVLGWCDAVISCLPYHLNVAAAKAAMAFGLHYFDLTEDVGVAREIRKLGSASSAVVASQCGLAPGFISIAGASLASRLEKIRSIKLRVGALPQHPTGLLGYAFNWSAEGVVNEYLNDCEVIENKERKWVSPVEWIEKIFIDGVQFEAFTTSGGIGTMCETYDGLVDNLDYKSIRYPGHADLMNFFFHELLMRDDRQAAGNILVNAKPPVSEDAVYIHASAEGWDGGKITREELVRTLLPVEICGKRRRAIAWTTAASVCSVVEMVRSGDLPDKGLVTQEKIPLNRFLASRCGRLYDGKPHGGSLRDTGS
jgi:saccharopine dehydrogenase-like NADP-dependent oxidoreductase